MWQTRGPRPLVNLARRQRNGRPSNIVKVWQENMVRDKNVKGEIYVNINKNTLCFNIKVKTLECMLYNIYNETDFFYTITISIDHHWLLHF